MNELEMQKLSESSSTPEHYKLAITPQEYADANMLPFDEGNVVKYVSRHRSKNGAEDIIKAIHYCMFILKRDYGCESKASITRQDKETMQVKTLEVK